MTHSQLTPNPQLCHAQFILFSAVKGVNFFGLRSEYVVSGSDCGHVFLWDTDKQDIVQCMEGDMEGVVSSHTLLSLSPSPFPSVSPSSPSLWLVLSKDFPSVWEWQCLNNGTVGKHYKLALHHHT